MTEQEYDTDDSTDSSVSYCSGTIIGGGLIGDGLSPDNCTALIIDGAHPPHMAYQSIVFEEETKEEHNHVMERQRYIMQPTISGIAADATNATIAEAVFGEQHAHPPSVISAIAQFVFAVLCIWMRYQDDLPRLETEILRAISNFLDYVGTYLNDLGSAFGDLHLD